MDTVSYGELNKNVKPGDIFQNMSFGASKYLVVKILSKDDEEFRFEGIEIDHNLNVGFRLTRGEYREVKQNIAPSPYYYNDLSFYRGTVKSLFEKANTKYYKI